jgi:hypothetical protein
VCRASEIVFGGERRIRVGFDNEQFIAGRQADIDAPKTADSQLCANVARKLAEAFPYRFGKLGGGAVRDTHGFL